MCNYVAYDRICKRPFYIYNNSNWIIHVSVEQTDASTTFTQSAQKATGVGEIKQALGLLRRSRSFKVIEFGTNRKPMRLPISD